MADRKSLRVQIEELDHKLDNYICADKEWKLRHEHNHHGAKSKIVTGVPWTILSIFGYVLINLLGR